MIAILIAFALALVLTFLLHLSVEVAAALGNWEDEA